VISVYWKVDNFVEADVTNTMQIYSANRFAAPVTVANTPTDLYAMSVVRERKVMWSRSISPAART
jgi:hypothetical protein